MSKNQEREAREEGSVSEAGTKPSGERKGTRSGAYVADAGRGGEGRGRGDGGRQARCS